MCCAVGVRRWCGFILCVASLLVGCSDDVDGSSSSLEQDGLVIDVSADVVSVDSAIAPDTVQADVLKDGGAADAGVTDTESSPADVTTDATQGDVDAVGQVDVVDLDGAGDVLNQPDGVAADGASDAYADATTDATIDASTDSSDGSAAGQDAGVADSGPPPPLKCGFQLVWTQPSVDELYAMSDKLSLAGQLKSTGTWAATSLKVQWRSNGQVLGESAVNAAGEASFDVQLQSSGLVALEAQVVTPQGLCVEVATHSAQVCAQKIAEDFNQKPTGAVWKTYGDAYWDKGGWLEMTGNAKSKQGAFYDVAHSVAPGDASVRFRIATGGGINSGADGYALNFVEAPAISELEKIIKTAGKGGCLGYGVSGDCGSMKILGFHVEFDTWQNKKDPNIDPSPANHIGVMLNGDATNHKLHVPLSNLEDLKWHDVRVDVIGTKVRVFWDGQKKLEKVVPDLDFRGGRIYVSGSTGWATNFHRLDDLVVLHGCK